MDRHYVGAEHSFHDPEFARGWAERFVPTPPRRALFDRLLGELAQRMPADGHLVELGVGPGYLAEHLLQGLPRVRYTALDFSAPMLTLAANRLAAHGARLRMLQADLVRQDWSGMLERPVHAVVSTWSLHDLGGQPAVAAVYAACAATLEPGGVLLNGDFIKPQGSEHEYEPGRFEIERHLDLLAEAGFAESSCLMTLEQELEAPTAAQNYACLLALR